jgi:hypothetical protein
MTQHPRPVYITYLNRFDIEALALADAEILAAIAGSLAMQGGGETVVEPRMHIEPRAGGRRSFQRIARLDRRRDRCRRG